MCSDGVAAFERALAAHLGDKSSQLYVERCRHFLENPPPEAWNGVFVMTEK